MLARRIRKTLKRCWRGERGSVAIQMGLSIVGIIGVVGLGTEGTFLVYKQRQLQSVTDSAAMSAVMALEQEYPRDPESEANTVAANLGFTDGVDGATVTVNTPPESGEYAGDSDAVEVIVSQTNTISMVRMFTDKTVNISSRSVALRQETGRFCVLALDPSAPEAMYVYNNGTISGDCGVAVNSTNSSALYMRNNAIIEGSVMTPGGTSLANNAHFDYNEDTGQYGDEAINGPPVADPYADVELGTPTGPCLSGSGSNNYSATLDAGHYCDGWDFKNNVTLTLNPGTYYIDTKLKIKNNVVINGNSGVTIVINGDYAIDISNNAQLNITAPSDTDFAGIAFYSPRNATSSVTQKFENNTELNVTGAIYFPNQIVHFDNNATMGDTGCTHVIGRQVIIRNNAQLGNDCEGLGVEPISPPAKLVE